MLAGLLGQAGAIAVKESISPNAQNCVLKRMRSRDAAWTENWTYALEERFCAVLDRLLGAAKDRKSVV